MDGARAAFPAHESELGLARQAWLVTRNGGGIALPSGNTADREKLVTTIFDGSHVDDNAELILADIGAPVLEKRCKNGFSPEVIDTLLAKLSGDDDFRALFVANPWEALASIGHQTPDNIRGVAGEDPAMCCQVEKLASKAAIAAAADQIRGQMTIFNPFMYSGLIDS